MLFPSEHNAKPYLQRLLERARDANQPVPKNVGIAREELNILGGAPVFLSKVERGPSVPPTCPNLGGSIGRESCSTNTSLLQSVVRCQNSPVSSTDIASETSPRQRQSVPTNVNGSPQNNIDSDFPSDLVAGPSNLVSRPNYSASQAYHSSDGNDWGMNAYDMSSTSWLEELSNHVPVGLGQTGVIGSNDAGLGFLLGTRSDAAPMEVPRPEPGDDPVIAEAWRSLLAGS